MVVVVALLSYCCWTTANLRSLGLLRNASLSTSVGPTSYKGDATDFQWSLQRLFASNGADVDLSDHNETCSERNLGVKKTSPKFAAESFSVLLGLQTITILTTRNIVIPLPSITPIPPSSREKGHPCIGLLLVPVQSTS